MARAGDDRASAYAGGEICDGDLTTGVIVSNEKMDMSPEMSKKLAQMRTSLPKAKREVEDILRLVALARQAPFAGVNVDFLDRMEQVWNARKAETEFSEMLMGVIDEVEKPKA